MLTDTYKLALDDLRVAEHGFDEKNEKKTGVTDYWKFRLVTP